MGSCHYPSMPTRHSNSYCHKVLVCGSIGNSDGGEGDSRVGGTKGDLFRAMWVWDRQRAHCTGFYYVSQTVTAKSLSATL